MLKSYNEFISESNWITSSIVTFFNEDGPFRMYLAKSANDIKDAEVQGLKYKQEHFQHTSEDLYIVLNDESPDSGDSYYDRLVVNLDAAASQFLLQLDRMAYPAIYALNKETYLGFSYEDHIGHNDKLLIANSNDDHDTIRIFKKPEELFQLFLVKIRNDDHLNDLKGTEFEFVSDAKGFENSNLYKSLTSGNKFNLFEKSEWDIENGKLFIYSSMQLKDGNIKLVSLKERDLTKAAKMIFGEEYGNLNKTESNISETYTDVEDYYFSVERERLFDKGLEIKFGTFEQIVREGIERHIDYTSDIFKAFKLEDELVIEYKNGWWKGTKQSDDAIVFDLQSGKYSIRKEYEKEAFDFIFKSYREAIPSGNWTEDLINSLPEEQKNYLKSIKGVNKFKLFDYNSFNESLTNGTFKYVQLHSFAIEGADFIKLTNDPKAEEDKLREDVEYIGSFTIELEKPIKPYQEIYTSIIYSDDNTFFDASINNSLKLTKNFIEGYNNMLEADMLPIEEMYGRVSLLSFETKKYSLISIDDSKYIINKKYDEKELISFNDELIFKAIDSSINIETIKAIEWKDPEFEKKYDLLKNVGALKRYNI